MRTEIDQKPDWHDVLKDIPTEALINELECHRQLGGRMCVFTDDDVREVLRGVGIRNPTDEMIDAVWSDMRRFALFDAMCNAGFDVLYEAASEVVSELQEWHRV